MDAETRKSAQMVDRWLASLSHSGRETPGHEKCGICRAAEKDLDIPAEAVYPKVNGEDIDEARENLEVEDCE